jgi:hypothetical protein
MKNIFDLIMRSPQSALEDVIGLTAIVVMFIATLHIVPVL